MQPFIEGVIHATTRQHKYVVARKKTQANRASFHKYHIGISYKHGNRVLYRQWKSMHIRPVAHVINLLH